MVFLHRVPPVNPEKCFLLVSVLRQHPELLFYPVFAGQEKPSLPSQHLEQKLQEFLMKMSPF